MKKVITHTAMILIGNFLLAFSVCAFTVPSQITVGGATGIGLILSSACGIPMSVTVLIVNLICLPLAWIFVGRKLVQGSVISSFAYPLALSVVQRIPGITEISSGLMLSAVCAGVIGGTGVGLVMKAEGSTGGLDIPPLILRKKMRIPVRVSMYAMDAVIMLLQLPFCQTDRVIYGIISAFLFTQMIDRILLLGEKKYDVRVVTDQFEELRMMLLRHDFGVTMELAETGLRRKQIKQLTATVSAASLNRVINMIRKTDEHAFVRITQVTTVLGRGFDLEKVDAVIKE